MLGNLGQVQFLPVVEVRQTEVYARWFRRLRDPLAQKRIADRVERLTKGNPGDVRAVGQGVSELRLDHGPGYRIYFARRGSSVVILLAGGDKSTQQRDIPRAIEVARTLKGA